MTNHDPLPTADEEWGEWLETALLADLACRHGVDEIPAGFDLFGRYFALLEDFDVMAAQVMPRLVAELKSFRVLNIFP